jgi:hypothetical protein
MVNIFQYISVLNAKYYSSLGIVMKKHIISLRLLLLLCFLSSSSTLLPQSKGLKTITEKELRYHLEFLGAKEFRGRETPSPELDIAALYLANWSKNAGLKPVMQDGSFFQAVPVTVTNIIQPGTKITVSGGAGDRIYYYGREFGGNFSSGGCYSGDVVFAGTGISDPENGWDDLKGLDLSGKIVIILDAFRRGEKIPAGPYYYYRLNSVVSALKERGASAVLSVVSPERERKLDSGFNIFDEIPAGKMGIIYDSQRTDFDTESNAIPRVKSRPSLPFEYAEISHTLASEILGITVAEIDGMFSKIKDGEHVAGKSVMGVRVQLDVAVESEKSVSRNVVAVVEGSDPVLRNEYVVICGHPDGLGLREGEILPGADDNATASVALIEIAQALLTERPKRSVIIAWFTGEEKIMNGSNYFINNCPVPIEKITACLDMDMLGRNSTDSLFLVCPDLLSSELDASINKMNRKSDINFAFDYRYSNINNPEQVYFRSDHYPFLRFGIPSVWFFSGFTPDYHTPRDATEFINYPKFYRITKLVYLTAFDVGNMKELLKLDRNPKVTSRGKHNLHESSLFRYTGR